ncbi:epithelial cell adhesion molecule [Salminus brasiliensis]|uniref:epithelial cell adhesion molecule n=1 Tax=Salminus brasiliensis TaxID=930266 RepID=UPI003B82F365
MRTLIVLCLLAFVAGASAECGTCKTMKWGICDGGSCQCGVPVGTGDKQALDCTKLVPKCFLMKAEMYRARNKLSTRTIGGKPVETAFVDNDGIYDPECENNGRFKAVQCNGTETCWCVNSAGVRRSDKGDKNIKCEPVETYWVRLQMTHKKPNTTTTLDASQLKTAIENVLGERYSLAKKFVTDVEYDGAARRIVVDLKKQLGQDRDIDLPRVAYYMEKDIKVLPLFMDPKPFSLSTANTGVSMEDILVYYVDEQAPTFTMKNLTGGVIAVIVVVVLAVVIGLLALFFLRRREQANYKSQARELEPMS